MTHAPSRFLPPSDGAIRELRAIDLPLFRDHLLRLDAASRRDRFNGTTDEAFVSAYAARCFEGGATVIAFMEDGVVRGAAELHERLPGRRDSAEIAFSVEEGFQRRGIGSRLFERLIARAKGLGYGNLLVTTHPQNEAMKALARKFGARLSFQNLETVGMIELDGTARDVPVKALDLKPEAREEPRTVVAAAELARAIARLQFAAIGLGRPPQTRG